MWNSWRSGCGRCTAILRVGAEGFEVADGACLRARHGGLRIGNSVACTFMGNGRHDLRNYSIELPKATIDLVAVDLDDANCARFSILKRERTWEVWHAWE